MANGSMLPVITVGLVATVAGCSATPTPGTGDAGAPANVSTSAASLLYVLQPEDITTDRLVAEPFTWIVLEPSRTGGAEGDIPANEIARMRTGGPCGGRTVLAYLSIGEAEEVRDYWDPNWIDADGSVRTDAAPAWLGPSNPDFPDNYKVRYWNPEWQDLILGTATGPDRTPLDRIIDAGFDGVYLDIVGAFEFWSSERGNNELTRADARARMIAWVRRIADYARRTRGVDDFLVFPQNAEDIIRDDDEQLDELSEVYLAAIDGIGIEDLFFNETAPQPEDEIQFRLQQLAEYRRRGKTVLVTDYVLTRAFTPADSDALVAEFYDRVRTAGFIPYAAVEDRDLDEVVVLRPPEWSVAQPTTDCSSP